MASRENTVIGGCILAGFIVGAAISEYTALSTWVAIAVFLVLAIFLPVFINFYSGQE